MIPANLRKFDMSIYIFESTINQLHWTNSGFAHMYNSNSSMYPRAAFKRIELHDCEFDYNLNKAGYSTIDNAEGFQQTYEIPITVGDAFEYRYNPFIDRSIGDAIAIDMVHGLYKDMKIEKIWRDASQTTDDSVITSLKQRLEKFKYGSVDLFGMVNQLTGEVATQFVKSQLLGNLHQTSIGDLTRNVKGMINDAMNGNPGAVKAYVDNLKEAGNGWYVKEIGKDNIYTRGAVKNQTEKEPFTPSSIATNKYQETTQPTDPTNKSNQQGSTSTYSSPSQSNLTPYRLWSDVGKTQTIQSTRLSNDVDYDDTLDAPYENIFQKQ